MSKLLDIGIIVFCIITCALIIFGLIVILPISAKCQNCTCGAGVLGGTLNVTLGNLTAG
jgi:hypothetical protein